MADQPGVDHLFSVTRFDASQFERINGKRPTGTFRQSGYTDYLPALYISNSSHVDISGTGTTANDFAALKARTNPSRPMLTPLTTIQDLKDLPKMVKELGYLKNRVVKGKANARFDARDLANYNLAAQFGWLPLIDDLKKLTELQTHIHRRGLELDKLYQRSGLKRRIQLGSWHAESTNTASLLSGICGTYKSKNKIYTSVNKWGTIRWLPTSPPPVDHSTEDRNRRIRKILLGLSQEGLTKGLWDIIPWTWMTDWFVNVGDYMLSHSNTVPATSSHACVMTLSDTTYFCSPSDDTSSWVDGGTGITTLITKSRSVNSSPVIASLPYIGLGRLSILGSLFVQRATRPTRTV